MKRLGLGLTEAQLSTVVELADSSGDGRLNYKEFHEQLVHPSETQSAAVVEQKPVDSIVQLAQQADDALQSIHIKGFIALEKAWYERTIFLKNCFVLF